MWSNRIKLEMVKHDAARNFIKNKLSELNKDEECITGLNITAHSGYMFYEITLFDKQVFKVSDDGKEM